MLNTSYHVLISELLYFWYFTIRTGLIPNFQWCDMLYHTPGPIPVCIIFWVCHTFYNTVNLISSPLLFRYFEGKSIMEMNPNRGYISFIQILPMPWYALNQSPVWEVSFAEYLLHNATHLFKTTVLFVSW